MASTKKPVLIIKKGHLSKPNSLILHKAIKRSISDEGSQNENTDAKRACPMIEVQIPPMPEKPNVEQGAQNAKTNSNDHMSKDKHRRRKIKIDKNAHFCQSHREMQEHQAKGLVHAGDIFSSAEEFTNYANTHAKEWLFYYVTTSSRNSKLNKNYDELKPTYFDYKCRYFKGEHKSTSKGLRKVKVETIACPANVRMRRRRGENHFEVIRACHHHNHKLSWELFNQLPHGHRLPQEVKDEIRDLTRFGLDSMLLRKYLRFKLGMDMNKTVYNFMAKVKKDEEQPHYTPEKVKEILSNIKFIKSNFAIPNRSKKDAEMIHNVRELHKTEVDNEMQTNAWKGTMVNEVEIKNYSANDVYSKCKISPADGTLITPFITDNISTADSADDTNHEYVTEVYVDDDISTVEETNHEYDTEICFKDTLSTDKYTNNDYDSEICIKYDISTMEDTHYVNDNDTESSTVMDYVSSIDDSTHENCNDGEICVTNAIKTAKDTNVENDIYTETCITNDNSTEYTNQEKICDSECDTDSNKQCPMVNTINDIAISGSIKDPQQKTHTKKTVVKKFIKIIPISQIGKVNLLGAYCTARNIDTVRPINDNVSIEQPVDTSPIIINTNDQVENNRISESITIRSNDNVNGTGISKSNILMSIGNITNVSNVDDNISNKNNQRVESQRILNPETGEFTTASIIDYKLDGVIHDDSVKSTLEHCQLVTESETNSLKELSLDQTIPNEPKEDVKIELVESPIFKKEDMNLIEPYEPSRKDRTDLPEVRCLRRHINLPEYKAEGLVQVGDVFESIEAFYRYANERAKHWFFYYMVCDSRNSRNSHRHNNKRASYVFFSCRFNKGKRIGTESRGIRKRKPKNIICPAGVQLKSSAGTTSFYVTYVCHHHSHELSPEMFKQESHGYRLPQELKNEIHQLLWLKLDREHVQRYVRSVTGYNLRKTICNIHQRMQRTNMEINMTPDKIKEVLDKIKEIKATFSPVEDRASLVKLEPKATEHDETNSQVETSSRVETRLNNILYDQELLHSVQELEKSMGCEIHIDTWEGDYTHVKQDTLNLQEGLIEYADILQSDEGDNENQIEVDSQLYAMDENVHYIIPHGMYSADDTAEQDDENYRYEEVDNDQVCSDFHNEAKYECMMYTQDEEHLENDEEQKELSHLHIENYRDVGIQADFEIIKLERDCELLNRLESKSLIQDLNKSRPSFSTRGNPKIALEERIINRFNIEFYIGLCGITTCLENLASTMKLSVIDLLKKIYQGEAVFKMYMGRSGKNGRKSVQLKYVPLTIAFPFEKFKYINGLQEYKTMCSKYSDMVLRLESVVDDLSNNLKVMESRYRGVEVYNKELIENTEDLKRALKSSNESMKKRQAESLKVQAMNEKLLNKNTELEKNLASLKLSFVSLEKSQVELHEAQALKETLLKKNTELKIDQVQSKLERQNELLQIKIRELENVLSPRNSVLYEKIKILEETRDKLNDENESQKKKITHLEDLYLADSQTLLDKIKVLEEELNVAKKEISIHKHFSKSETCLISLEIENKMLHKKIKNIQELKDSEKQILLEKQETLNNKIKELEDLIPSDSFRIMENNKELYKVVTTLKKRLKEKEPKLVEVVNIESELADHKKTYMCDSETDCEDEFCHRALK